METRQKLETALKEAMRSGDVMRKGTVRMVMSTLKLEEVKKGSPLDDAGVIAIIQREIKSRAEALQDAEKAGRADLVAKARQESAYLESFLPQQLTPEELDALAQEAIREVDAKGPADMGRVMKIILPKVQGRAAGDQVSQAVRRNLPV